MIFNETQRATTLSGFLTFSAFKYKVPDLVVVFIGATHAAVLQAGYTNFSFYRKVEFC
jgi:hypothetical protein